MKKCYILLTCLFFTGYLVQAQIFPYYFSVEEEAVYTPLSDSISLNNGQIWDDPNFAIPLGFNFDLYDFSTDTILIGDVATLIYVSDLEDVQPILIAYGTDIIDIGEINGIASESEISYKVEGTAGSKIVKIEWKNVGFYEEVDQMGTANNTLSFQVWLFEGSNNIEIHFGPNNIEDDALVHGEIGPLTGIINGYDFNLDDISEFWYLTGDPQNPTLDTLFDIDNYVNLVGLNEDPANGTIYRFSTSLPTAVSNPIVAQNVKVYPTVANDFIQIEINDLALNDVSMEVYDGIGRQVMGQSVVDEFTRVNIQGLATGIYFIHINTNEGLTTKKIIKQ